MPMVCPQCSSNFERRVECPNCGVRLMFTGVECDADGHGWQHTPLGRIIIGVFLSQGLALALRMLVQHNFSVTTEENPDTWSTLLSIAANQGINVLCVLFVGILAAAGQRQGLIIGSMLGLINSGIILALQVTNNVVVNEVSLYGQPVLLTFVGAVGGLVGASIWRPLPVIQLAEVELQQKNKKKRPKSNLFSGPIAWTRVLMGTGIAIAGVVSSAMILRFFLKASDGQLTISSEMQARIITWEISGLAVLLGSCLAGSNTFNGMKQGLSAGVTTAILLVFLQLSNQRTTLEELILTAVCTVTLAIVGGWFGCRLFPPVVAYRRRGSQPFTP